jgi:hypothetical protein
MSQSIEEIIDDIASGRIKVDGDIQDILPSMPERYMLHYGETVLTRHE